MATEDDKWRFYEITHPIFGKRLVRASELLSAYIVCPMHRIKQHECSLSITIKDPQIGLRPILSY